MSVNCNFFALSLSLSTLIFANVFACVSYINYLMVNIYVLYTLHIEQRVKDRQLFNENSAMYLEYVKVTHRRWATTTAAKQDR